MQEKILIVEDDYRVRSQLERGLVEEGYEVEAVASGTKGDALAREGGYDCIVLDWRLPDKSGLEICRDMRAQRIGAPVLMLTAMDAVSSRVEGLDAGADDYLTKPFSFDELLARIRALLRRTSACAKEEDTSLAYGELKLDPRKYVFVVGKHPVELTRREFALAQFFLQHPEEVLSRREISRRVWHLAFETNTNFIDVYVRYLRRKIARHTDGEYIRSVRGIGYVLRNGEGP